MPGKTRKDIRPPWQLVMEEMVMVDISITYWRGKAKLDLTSDLGLIDTTLNESDEQYKKYLATVDEVILGGQRRLLPPDMEKRLAKIERAAREHLERLSFQTRTMFGNLMPKKNYELFVQRLTQDAYDEKYPERGSLEEDFFRMRDEIVAGREEILSYIRRSHRNLAIVAWRLQEGLSIDAVDMPPETWIEEYLSRVAAALPSAQKIYDSFTFEYTVSNIPVPDEAVKQVRLDELEAEKQRLDNEIRRIEEEREYVESSANRQAAVELARSKTEAERAEHAAKLAQAKAEQERIERELKIQREISTQAISRIEKSISPALDEITTRVRSMLYEQTLNALVAVKKNQKLPPQTIGALKKLIANSRELNWTDDGQINAYLNQLQDICGNFNAANDGERASQALQQTLDSLKQDLNDIGVKTRERREFAFATETIAFTAVEQRNRQKQEELLNDNEELSLEGAFSRQLRRMSDEE